MGSCVPQPRASFVDQENKTRHTTLNRLKARYPSIADFLVKRECDMFNVLQRNDATRGIRST